VAELALPEQAQGAAGTLDIFEIPAQTGAVGSSSFELQRLPGPYYYRARHLYITGRVIAFTTGTYAFTFNIYSAGNLLLSAPAVITATPADDFRTFSWSTEAGANYSGYEALLSGQAAVMGIPLVTAPGPALFEFNTVSFGPGADGQWRIDQGTLQVERFTPGPGGGGAGDSLPDLTPVYYLTEDAA
jgi:hypothetical protein